jgi:GT2 family glycosyltransferase
LRPGTGCVGAKLYYPNDTIQHAGVIIGLGGVAGHSHKMFGREESGYCGRLMVAQNVSAVTAACLIVRKAIYDEVGGLDEENLKVAFNDVDFCLKVVKAGYMNVWTPFAELYHHESISRGSDSDPVKAQRFRSEFLFMRTKWNKMLDEDPHYSPNLTHKLEDFSVKID